MYYLFDKGDDGMPTNDPLGPFDTMDEVREAARQDVLNASGTEPDDFEYIVVEACALLVCKAKISKRVATRTVNL